MSVQIASQSTSIATLAKALVKAQAALRPAVKDSTNPFFHSTYADLGSIWEACRDALTANGLSVSQFPGYEAGTPPYATLTTILLHESGEWLSGTGGAPMPDQVRKDGSVEKANAQGMGSAITYLRRYGLAAVLGIVQADDDGNSAAGKPVRGKSAGAAPKEPSSAPPPAPKPAPDGAPTGFAPMYWKGKKLADMPSDDLVKLRDWMAKSPGKWTAKVDEVETVLAGRDGE